MFTRYSVEIGDALWTALYSHVADTYGIESVCEDGDQKFAVLTAEDKYYRLNFSISEEGIVEFAAEVEVLENYTPDAEPQFNADAVAEYAKSKKKKDEDEEEDKKKPAEDGEEEPSKEDPEDDEPAKKDDSSDEDTDDGKEEKCPKCHKPKSECECDDDEEEDKKSKGKKEKYNLDDIQEYVELSEKYSNLETEYSNAQQKIADLESQIGELTAFKNKVDKAEKQKMIDGFYMLSDEEKADVVANIDTYSLEDIEAKLSIICVRNKVNFNLDDDKSSDNNPTTFNLDGGLAGDETVPAWIKALRSVASEM